MDRSERASFTETLRNLRRRDGVATVGVEETKRIDYALARLVLVATSSWKDSLATHLGSAVSSGADAAGSDTGHGSLLAALLSGSGPGQAWICADPAGDDPTNDQASISVTHHARGTPEAQALRSDLVARGTRDCGKARMTNDPKRRAELLGGLRHRIFLDTDRLAALTSSAPEDLVVASVRPYVALDLSFHYLLDTVRLHVSSAVFSAPPCHARFGPKEIIGKPGPVIRSKDIDECRKLFLKVAGRIQTLLDAHLHHADTLRVLGHSYALPMFWVAVPKKPNAIDNPADYLIHHRAEMNHLSNIFLDVWDARDCIVAHGVVNGQFLTLRRFQRMPDSQHMAHYLVVPRIFGANHTTLTAQERADQEEHAAHVVTALTNLEARGGGELYGVLDDLEIWRNHIRVYDSVAERAFILWDALATHLPVRRLRGLSQVHKTVDLLHQILLQGVADLAHLVTLAEECQTRIETTGQFVVDEYDDTLTERHDYTSHGHSAEGGLRTALTRTGFFSRTKDQGRQITAEARRVRNSYDDLIKAIASAFDERRVRESESLQRAGSLFGLVVALIGMVTVFDAVVAMKPDGGSLTDTNDAGTQAAVSLILGGGHWIATTTAWASAVLGALLLIMATVAIVWSTRLGLLGSAAFRRSYKGGRKRRDTGMWRFLKDASTETLERVKRDLDASAKGQPHRGSWVPPWALPPDSAYPGADPSYVWNRIDVDLATRFATLWDQAGAAVGSRQDPRSSRDIMTLAQQVEQWGLQALLLTERARRMHRYSLPRLTCLYRVAGPERLAFLSAFKDADKTSLVAENDFNRVMQNLGFSVGQVDALDSWLRHGAHPTMTELLETLDRCGLSVPMVAGSHADLIDRVLAAGHTSTIAHNSTLTNGQPTASSPRQW